MKTTTESFEARLGRLFETPLPDDLARRIDARVAQIVASAPPATPRRGTANPLRRGLVLGLAASFVLVGITIASLTALERLTRDAPTGWQLAWERAVVIGQTVDTGRGVLTVERAYADTNLVVIGMSGAIEELGPTSLVDQHGREYSPTIALGANGGELAEWLPPEPLPPQELHLTLSGSGTTGPWSIDFVVPATGGTSLQPGAIASAHGLSMTLTRVAISPTGFRADVRIDSAAAGVEAHPVTWTYYRDGIAAADLNAVGVATTTGTAHVLFTLAGTDESSGSWELRITEMMLSGSDGQNVRVQGPWIFTFEVP